MKVKVKKLHELAKLPEYATSGAAGFDLISIEDVTLMPGETKLVGTGLAFEIPSGHEIQVRPRSGMSLKTKLRVANSPGTVDEDFRGELKVIVENITAPVALGFTREEDVITIKAGDRIAQGVLCPILRAEFELAEELTDTSRGEGGFGSTGVSNE